MSERLDNRAVDQIRNTIIEKDYIKGPLGSAFIQVGNTKVICTCSMEEKVPPFLKDKGQGWITAEYGMLPGCTKRRITREASRGKVSGRTAEIQRLIGRSLRAVCDLSGLGERTLYIDCDVIQADGGTRTASITGAFVALADAVFKLDLKEKVILNHVAAISVGICNSSPMLDLCYEEDFAAEVDMNVVMTDDGRFIEIQGTAEEVPFTLEQNDKLLNLAKKGVDELIKMQKQMLK